MTSLHFWSWRRDGFGGGEQQSQSLSYLKVDLLGGYYNPRFTSFSLSGVMEDFHFGFA